VLDNLERAVEHSFSGADTDKMLQGVHLVLKQFRDGLSHFGVEPIDAEGAPFDPHIHEAMSRVETEGDPPDGTVVEVYQKGYLLYGRVLRPAMVGVAKLVDEVGGETQG
jgi:molecular chaperone GrpE